MLKRISTGIPGLNDIFLGGFIQHRSYLILGSAGTGKTILSLQWLLEGLRQGDKCLYISLGESREEIQGNIEGFGWNLEGISVIDLMPPEFTRKETIDEYHIFLPAEVEQSTVWKMIYEAIAEKKPDRVVIDSAAQLWYLSTDIYQFRKHMLGLTRYLNNHAITSLLLFEPAELKNDSSVALAVDGILRLRMRNSPGSVIGLRYMEIEKLRGSGFLSGFHPFRITNKGIRVFPHKIESLGKASAGTNYVTSNILELDEMLGGGIEAGTTTIISGPTGTGKSTLASQFLINEAMKGVPALYLTFEESKEFIVRRCRATGHDIDDLVANNMLKILHINPMQIYPDELLSKVRHLIREGKYKIVMIDSLRGYILAMEEFGLGTIIPHLHNLITYLNRQHATTFIVNEIESITGVLKVTEHGLSHLGDNILLLRFAEQDGRVIKIIACLKKRLGDFQTETREFKITAQGILLSEKLKNIDSILTGRRSPYLKKAPVSSHESD